MFFLSHCKHLEGVNCVFNYVDHKSVKEYVCFTEEVNLIGVQLSRPLVPKPTAKSIGISSKLLVKFHFRKSG